MYNGVGLPTPRGSGTNGYIQRNISHLRPRRTDMLSAADAVLGNSFFKESLSKKGKGGGGGKFLRQDQPPDEELLLHDEKRSITARLFAEKVRLVEEEGKTEEEAEKLVNRLRRPMLEALAIQRRMNSSQHHHSSSSALGTGRSTLFTRAAAAAASGGGGGSGTSYSNRQESSRDTATGSWRERGGREVLGESAAGIGSVSSHEIAAQKQAKMSQLAEALSINTQSHCSGAAFDFQQQEQQREERKKAWEERRQRMIEERKEFLIGLQRRRREEKKRRKEETRRRKKEQRRQAAEARRERRRRKKEDEGGAENSKTKKEKKERVLLTKREVKRENKKEEETDSDSTSSDSRTSNSSDSSSSSNSSDSSSDRSSDSSSSRSSSSSRVSSSSSGSGSNSDSSRERRRRRKRKTEKSRTKRRDHEKVRQVKEEEEKKNNGMKELRGRKAQEELQRASNRHFETAACETGSARPPRRHSPSGSGTIKEEAVGRVKREKDASMLLFSSGDTGSGSRSGGRHREQAEDVEGLKHETERRQDLADQKKRRRLNGDEAWRRDTHVEARPRKELEQEERHFRRRRGGSGSEGRGRSHSSERPVKGRHDENDVAYTKQKHTGDKDTERVSGRAEGSERRHRTEQGRREGRRDPGDDLLSPYRDSPATREKRLFSGSETRRETELSSMEECSKRPGVKRQAERRREAERETERRRKPDCEGDRRREKERERERRLSYSRSRSHSMNHKRYERQTKHQDNRGGCTQEGD